MYREYEIAEKVGDKLVWRDTVVGKAQALKRLQELAKTTANELVMMHSPTNSVVVEVQGRGPQR